MKNEIVKPAAIRNRDYCGKGSAIEVRPDDFSNCLTSLLDKDCVVLIVVEENLQNTKLSIDA